MRRPLRSGVFTLALTAALGSAACSDSSNQGLVTPTPAATTETFTGTLNLSGGVTFPFVATQAGSAIATLTNLDPDLTMVVAAGGSGSFSVGETVYQGASLDEATIRATVMGWSAATRQLVVKDVSGAFTTGTAIVGANGATWTAESIDTPVVGIALGTWSGTTCSVHAGEGLISDVAGTGSLVTGVVQGQGSLCVRVYDVGKLPIAGTFTIDVTHF